MFYWITSQTECISESDNLEKGRMTFWHLMKGCTNDLTGHIISTFETQIATDNSKCTKEKYQTRRWVYFSDKQLERANLPHICLGLRHRCHFRLHPARRQRTLHVPGHWYDRPDICTHQTIKTYLERQHSILLSVTHMLYVYQVKRCRLLCKRWELFGVNPGVKVNGQY